MLERYGQIKIIDGKFNSKFPYCRTVFIDDGNKAVIDPGAGRAKLIPLIKENRIKFVFNTHYHYDHIHYNYLFYRSKIFMNPIEAKCFVDRTNILKKVGIFEILGQDAIDEWLFFTKQVNSKRTPYSPSRNHAWYLSTCRLDGIYNYGEMWELGRTEFKFIHAPGHSAGFSCVVFPQHEAIFTGDIDLTPFGPWYGGSDSDIDEFIDSAWKIASLDLKYYITAHEIGTVSHEEFVTRLEPYLALIDERDQKILEILEKRGAQTLDDITSVGLIYGGPKFLVDPWVLAWEKMTIKKHLERLRKNKKLDCRGELYEPR
ncbi:MAG: MBL fold metallo-hydrolase [Candidatus Helarchaeota archaeon]